MEESQESDCAESSRDVILGPVIDESTRRRFLAKLAVDDQTKCWPWRHAIASTGYGLISSMGKCTGAHQVSYEIFKGPIPEGLWVLHNCPGGDRRDCVNPAHLWAGTQDENNQDAAKKGRTPSGNRHWNTKIPEESVPQIKQMFQAGLSQKEIAAHFGVHQSHISCIISGTRRHRNEFPNC